MELIRRPHSQDSHEFGAAACSAIATVFAIHLKADQIEHDDIDWDQIVMIGSVVHKTWLKRTNGVHYFCEPYELCTDVKEVQAAMDKRSLRLSIASGSINGKINDTVPTKTELATFRDEIDSATDVPLTEALTVHLPRGCNAVLVHYGYSYTVARPAQGDHFFFYDSHTCEREDSSGLGLGEVWRARDAATLVAWLCGGRFARYYTKAEENEMERMQRCQYSLSVFSSSKSTHADRGIADSVIEWRPAASAASSSWSSIPSNAPSSRYVSTRTYTYARPYGTNTPLRSCRPYGAL